MRIVSAALYAMVLCASMVSSAWPQERVARPALIIGNANYPDAGAPLSTAIADARTLAAEFRRSGFDVDLQENVGKLEMERSVDALAAKAGARGEVLFYFNGYGIQSERQTYLLPVNAQIWTEADVRRHGISLDQVLAKMHRSGARLKFLIIDAARRNPYERRFRSAAAGLSTTDIPENTLAIFSAAPGKLVNDGAGGGNSLFVTELVKELHTPKISADGIFNRVRVGVSRASNNAQIPWVASSLAEPAYFSSSAPVETVSRPREQGIASDVPCSDLSQARSPRTREPVNVTFSNRTNENINIIWLDFDGNQKIYRKLAAGQQYTQKTLQGHVWLVNDSNGRCLGIFKAQPARTVELK